MTLNVSTAGTGHRRNKEDLEIQLWRSLVALMKQFHCRVFSGSKVQLFEE